MTTPALATMTVADLLERHLQLHQQVTQHRVIATVDCDVDEDTGRAVIASCDGLECTGCDWMVGRDASAGACCPTRRTQHSQIRDVVDALQALDQPVPLDTAA